MTTILLLLFLAPEPPKPLDSLQWLIEGQWESRAKLPNGQMIESRTTWDWGPGRYSVRGRIYIRQGEDEYLRYESVVYLEDGRIKYITFTLQGQVIRGKGTIDNRSLILEQPKSELYPPMRSVFEPTGKESYVGKNYWKQGEEWKLVMTAECKRAPRKARKPVATRSPVAAKLDGFKPLIGRWKSASDHSGADVLEFERSLHGGLIRTTSVYSKDKRQVHWIYYDPKYLAIAVFGHDWDGEIERYILAVQTGEKKLALTVRLEDGEKVEEAARNTMIWKNPDEFESRIATREDGKWVDGEEVSRYRRIKK